MQPNDPPLLVASPDQLGPLPMPVEVCRTRAADETRITHAYSTQQIRVERERCYALGVAAERERCAMKLQVTRPEVQLAAGELSAQEWRTCAAVLRWMQVRIRGA